MYSNTPNFIIAGVMKAGTTALAYNLNQHHQIYCLTQYWKRRVLNDPAYNYSSQLDSWDGNLKVDNKETDFFNLDINYNLPNSFEIYRSFFPRKLKAIGESSPNYFPLDEANNGGAATRIAKDLPEAKIIILLRDPISRAFSHWNHIDVKKPSWGSDYYNKSFDEVVRLKDNNLLDRSKYSLNLRSWINTIGKDKVYVTLQESLVANPLREINKICDFLNVTNFKKEHSFKKIFALNYNSVIQPATIDYLKPIFANDVSKTKNLYPELEYNLWNNYL